MQYTLGRNLTDRQILYTPAFPPASGFYIAGCPDWAYLYLEEHKRARELTSFWWADAMEFA